MRTFIGFLKSVLFILSTFLVYTIYVIGLAFVKISHIHFEPWRNRCLSLWGKIVLRILSVKVVVNGQAPEPPFFLVSNHLSYLDIPVYYSCLKTTFISKSEIRDWPVVGWMARSLGVVFIDRKRKRDIHRVNTIISKKINDRQGVILFPEGKTSAGDLILPFRPSLLEHPANEGIPVHYSVIRYQTSKKDIPARTSVSWWEEISLFRHLIRLASNRKVTAQLTFGKSAIKNDDRKVLAKELQVEAESLFIPLSGS